MTDIPNEVNRHYHNHINVQETEKLHSTNCVNFFIMTFSALRVDLRSVTKIKTLIICHNIFKINRIDSGLKIISCCLIFLITWGCKCYNVLEIFNT